MKNRLSNRDMVWIVKDPPYQMTVDDWRRFADMNKRRAKRGAPPIDPKEWEEGVVEAMTPKPPKRKWTQDAIEHLQKWIYKHGGDTMTAAEVLELQGVNMTDLNQDLTAIENDYQARVNQGKARISEMLRWGLTTPEAAKAAEAAMIAEAGEAKDAALLSNRDLFFATVDKVRESHKALRWQAKLNSVPHVDDATRQRVTGLLAQIRSRDELYKLHADALAAGDESSAFEIERAGADLLANQPNREKQLIDGDVYTWQQRAAQQRERRAGAPLEQIKRDEEEIRAAFKELQSHPTARERTAFAKNMDIDEKYLPAESLIAGDLHLPPAEPVFD